MEHVLDANLNALHPQLTAHLFTQLAKVSVDVPPIILVDEQLAVTCAAQLTLTVPTNLSAAIHSSSVAISVYVAAHPLLYSVFASVTFTALGG